MKEAKAEILLASYNGADYICEQINSILSQTDNHWHLTLSDDGSTDGTIGILDEYVQKYPDRISRIQSNTHFGNARDHFFWLIKQCKSEYMLTCDQDDVWYPEKIERIMQAMQEAEETYGSQTPILVFTDQRPTDAELHPLAPSLMRYQNQYFGHFDYRSLLMQNVVTGGAMAFNRELADLACQCVNFAQTIMHDWWLAVVAARFGQVIYIDEITGDYRQHGANNVGAKNVKSISYVSSMVRRIDKLQESISRKKRQASVFYETYKNAMNPTDQEFLGAFVCSRSGMQFYWKNRELLHGFFRLAGMMILG